MISVSNDKWHKVSSACPAAAALHGLAQDMKRTCHGRLANDGRAKSTWIPSGVGSLVRGPTAVGALSAPQSEKDRHFDLVDHITKTRPGSVFSRPFPPLFPHGPFCRCTVEKPSMAGSLPRCVDTVIIGT